MIVIESSPFIQNNRMYNLILPNELVSERVIGLYIFNELVKENPFFNIAITIPKDTGLAPLTDDGENWHIYKYNCKWSFKK